MKTALEIGWSEEKGRRLPPNMLGQIEKALNVIRKIFYCFQQAGSFTEVPQTGNLLYFLVANVGWEGDEL